MAESSTPRFPRVIGAGAGLLAVGLLLGLLGGVAWGFLRPTYTVAFEDNAAVVDPASASGSVEFAALGWFAIVGAVIGLVLAAVAQRQVRKDEVASGIGQMLWLIAVAGAAAFTTFAAGELTVRSLYPVPPHGDTGSSDPFTLAPSVDPQVAWLVAPLVAAVAFWFMNFVELSRLTRLEASAGARGQWA